MTNSRTVANSVTMKKVIHMHVLQSRMCEVKYFPEHRLKEMEKAREKERYYHKDASYTWATHNMLEQH
jgi:uncharacterized protein YkuJ